MYNKKLYTVIHHDLALGLHELREGARHSCRQGLKEIYKESLGCEALSDLVASHADFSEQNAMEKACSKYYFTAFKDSVERGQPKDPHNFTTELHFWLGDGPRLLVAGYTAWGSARFLDFMDSDDLHYLSRADKSLATLNSVLRSPPLLVMSVLTPDSYHIVDPLWGS